ncbi:MAG: HAMP domain-containing sensor histidine kinase, partial [Campylobacterota bacterium]|nr:HAMP domain-containing sensor histidine kinase [Campylobacterota bacterium]
KEIIEVNDVFFEFFNQYSSIDEFKLHYKCLCDLFVPMDNEQYLIKTEHWLEDVLDVKLNTYKVALYKDEHLHHFILKARRIDILDTSTNNVVLNLIDITELIEKDKILLNQTNMASLGEMIGNIAHQWRQPLSVISTAASGMKVQKEFDVLENKDFIKGMDAIVEATQYLSDTIEDFREFIKGDMKNTYFNIDETVNKSLIILDAKLKNNNIKVIKNIDTKLMINNAANGLVQSLVNIINNAIDALMVKEVEEKYIWIKVFRDEHDVVIEVMDNAGGIPADIIDKIFEPYFTTKHQSQGTGLGLNMTYRLINEVMFGVIFVQNDHYTYDDKTYEGAKFIIKLTSD